MFRAEVRNIILSSIAHQSLFNRSSIALQSLIKRSSNAHQTLIKRSSSFGSSTLFPSLLGLSSVRCAATPRTARARMYSVRYILRQAPSGKTSLRPLLLLSTAHRLTAARPGTSRLLGGSGSGNIGSGGHCATLSTSCRPAARKASCSPRGAREREGSTERNICGALHHLAITASDATSRRGASFW
jgi:hypothetical protein